VTFCCGDEIDSEDADREPLLAGLPSVEERGSNSNSPYWSRMGVNLRAFRSRTTEIKMFSIDLKDMPQFEHKFRRNVEYFEKTVLMAVLVDSSVH
jgi:hypothetical protein